MSEKWPIKKLIVLLCRKKLRNNETEVFYVRPERPVKNSVRIILWALVSVWYQKLITFSCFSSSRRMIKVIQEVLGNPKKRENVLDPTDRLWLLNHTNYKVPQKINQMSICENLQFEFHICVASHNRFGSAYLHLIWFRLLFGFDLIHIII